MTLPAELALFLVVWQIITSRYLWKLQRNFLTRTRHPFPFLPSFCHLGFQKNHLWNRWKLSFVTFSRVQGSSWKMPVLLLAGGLPAVWSNAWRSLPMWTAPGYTSQRLAWQVLFQGKTINMIFFSPHKKTQTENRERYPSLCEKKIIVKAINEINSITEASSAPAQHSGIGEHLWGHTGLR